MSKLDDIRATIVAKMQSVEGIGLVHNYERFADKSSDMKALYVSGAAPNKLLLGWYVRRMGFKKTKVNTRYEITNRWRITGFMALDDAAGSELLFDALIERIDSEFMKDSNLGGVVFSLTDGDKSGLQLDDSGPLMFAGVLSHGARLSLSTTHIQQIGA